MTLRAWVLLCGLITALALVVIAFCGCAHAKLNGLSRQNGQVIEVSR